MTYASPQYNDNSNNGGGGSGGGSGLNIPEMFRSFVRKIPLMLIIFVLLAATGWYLASSIKRTYAAEARMMVTISDDYVFQPTNGQNTGGLILTPDSITLNEIAIMNNPELMQRVMAQVGYGRLFEDFSQNKLDRNRADVLNDMLKSFESAFAVAARPKSSIIDLRFEHENPDLAVETLNALIDEYKVARRVVFVEDRSDLLGQRREATEDQLNVIDQEIARFLRRNSIADFESEQEGVRERTEQLRAELNTLRGSMRQAEAALASTEDSLRRTPERINLYVDDRAAQRIAQAQLERKQLLAKYLPTSDPVKAKEREIAELQQLIAASGGTPTGGRRVGPNTVHQALMTERNKYQALADSYREKEYVLQGQLNSANAKVASLTSLSPSHQNLLREKKTLEVHLEQLNAREQTAIVDQQQAEMNSENVKEINRATIPRRGSNVKKIVQLLSVVGAAFTALMVGLLATFLDPRIYGPSTRMPVPEKAPKTAKEPKKSRKDRKRRKGDVAPSVPEPVQPYVPQEVPAYAPAAAIVAAIAPASPYVQADYQQPNMATGTDNYGSTASASYVAPEYVPGSGPVEYNPSDFAPSQAQSQMQTAAYATMGNAAIAQAPVQENPYQAAVEQASAPEGFSPAEQGFVQGANGEQVPIIGSTQTPPYTV